MQPHDEFVQLLYKAVDEINEERNPEAELEKSPDVVLFGPSGLLDSLSFVNFVVTVEEEIDRAYGRQINLIDIMLSEEDAEWTIAALAAHLTQYVCSRSHVNPTVEASTPV